MLGAPFDVTGKVKWHSDPRTGYEWKRDFHVNIPLYNLPGETDVKYPWELSRHQFFCELSRNYLFSGCEQSADRTRELMLDWIDSNPIYEGVNWTSGLEVAMRAISWIWSLAALSSWDKWRDEDLSKVAASLWDHATYLTNNFSHYSSPYNHLIGEATGLLWIATLFDSEQAQVFREQARKTLIDSSVSQFYTDHFCVEQAVGYHYYTLSFLVLAWTASRRVGEPLEALTDTIHSAFITGASFRRPDGTWPAIGDLDSARAIPVHSPNYWSFDSLQQLAAMLFDDPSLLVESDDPGEELFWLAGSDAITRWQQKNAPSAVAGYSAFSDAGYAVASDGRDWMLLDAGPVSAGLFPDATPSTAHGHADTLQVLYHCNGQSVLDDCGMPFYGGNQNWVAHFRGPSAHNTVHIDGANFVRRAGRLAWSHEVDRPTMNVDFKEGLWLCSASLTWKDAKHQRYVCCLPGQGLWIADLVLTDHKRNATWYWQLPDKIFGTSTSTVTWDSMSLSSVTSKDSGEIDLHRADPSDPRGWHCYDYGEKNPASCLSIRHQIEDKLLVLTSIGNIDRPQLSVEIDKLLVAEGSSRALGNDSFAEISGCRWFLPSSVASLPLGNE